MVVDERASELGMPETPRRAFWPVAVALLGLLVAALGAAFLLDQRYRPQVGVEPAPVTVVAQPAAAAVSAPPTAMPTAQPTATTAPTSVPTAAPTSPALAGPVSAPAAAPAVTRNPADLLSPLEKEIVDAYLRYWNVRAQAFYELDAARLKEVLAGRELARDEEDIRKLREQGRAADLDVELNFRIIKATPEEATVYDEYVNHSLYLDAATGQVLPTKEEPKVLKISFEMKKIEGTWKVVDVARHE